MWESNDTGLGGVMQAADVNFDGLIDFEEFQGMVYFLATEHLTTSQFKTSQRTLNATSINTSTFLDLKSFQPEVEPMVSPLCPLFLNSNPSTLKPRPSR
jgi:hypothetical protein